MKRVYLIRHALPGFPGGERMCLGRTDIPLGPEGRAQAAAMAKMLPPVTRVYSSPLQRAVETARAIAEPVILEDLQELSAGAWDGLTFRQIKERFPELYASRGQNKTLPLPGGESDGEGLARFRRGMDRAAEAAPGDFAVVAHGGVIRLFLEYLHPPGHKPGYAEIISLLWENGIFTLQEDKNHA